MWQKDWQQHHGRFNSSQSSQRPQKWRFLFFVPAAAFHLINKINRFIFVPFPAWYHLISSCKHAPVNHFLSLLLLSSIIPRCTQSLTHSRDLLFAVLLSLSFLSDESVSHLYNLYIQSLRFVWSNLMAMFAITYNITRFDICGRQNRAE